MSATLADLAAVPTEAMSTAELCRYRRDLLATLRTVDHWHRLVLARLDLAVAAVADIEEPVPGVADTMGVVPDGLRDLVGIPRSDQRLSETHVLLDLRAALQELERRTETLRERADVAAAAIAERLDRDCTPPPRRPEVEAG